MDHATAAAVRVGLARRGDRIGTGWTVRRAAASALWTWRGGFREIRPYRRTAALRDSVVQAREVGARPSRRPVGRRGRAISYERARRRGTDGRRAPARLRRNPLDDGRRVAARAPGAGTRALGR